MAKYKMYELSKKNWRRDFNEHKANYDGVSCRKLRLRAYRKKVCRMHKVLIYEFVMYGIDNNYKPRHRHSILWDRSWI